MEIRGISDQINTKILALRYFLSFPLEKMSVESYNLILAGRSNDGKCHEIF